MKALDRERIILSSLFLSKYGKLALDRLGFSSFSEAYNVIGAVLNAKPASIKGYRDELDPYFPNERVGWHNRPLRPHCKLIIDQYGSWTLDELATVIGGYLDPAFGLASLSDEELGEGEGSSTFARRLITGKAAENYFASNFHAHDEFSGGAIINTTQFGCGFDFRINFGSRTFFAVEVKGLREPKGQISLTSKEYERAEELGERYFLCVVSNFRDVPRARLWPNPLRSDLDWLRSEQMVRTTFWRSSI